MANENRPAVATKDQDIEIRKGAETRPLTAAEDIERWFEGFAPRGWLRPWSGEWPRWSELMTIDVKLPHVDVIDRDAEVVVRAEIPGVEKKDLNVTVTDDTVTIKASTRHEETEEKGAYYRHELSHGSFARTVALPADVDGSKAKASFKDGILELNLPKVAKSKRHSVKLD